MDFTRCQRPNGTFYGTAGQCRKGVEVPPLEEAVVMGRFNLAHEGHVDLVKEALKQAKTVNLIISDSSSNLDWNFRSLMLRKTLKNEGVDVSRVKFVKGRFPGTVIEELIQTRDPKSVGFFLGKDVANRKFIDGMSKKYGIKGGFIEAKKSDNPASSTRIRGAIDSKNSELLEQLVKTPYLRRLAIIGRQMEQGE